jgi:hypothetical protein
MKHASLIRKLAIIGIIALPFVTPLIAQCPFLSSLTTTSSKLYLYFPTSSDATFPEYDASAQTSPLEPFDVADLDAGIGTTTQLRNQIADIVKEDYCEFDMNVVTTTSKPNATENRWQIVGIGSDDEYISSDELFGVAQNVDLNDSDPQDYARIYAKSFLNAYGGASGALNGTNSTLARWATAIGHTVSHEAGHNFGLSHGNSSPRTGEDEQNNHIMATGNTGLTGEMRASRNRHFSDQSYEILGHNVGLRIKTLYNWDFVNPNAEDAYSLALTLLSPATTLTLSWSYNGTTSPWTTPTIAAAGTQSYQGTTYNRYTLTFSVPKAWSGGSNGVVPGGVEFHVGAAFAQSDLVIVYETTLRNNNGTDLNLHPRLAGFNTGSADLATGDFNLRAFNPNPAELMTIENVEVAFLPRLASIETMVSGAELLDARGMPLKVKRPTRGAVQIKPIELKQPTDIRLASFADPRSVELFYDSTGCVKGYKPGGAHDLNKGEIEYCPHGWALSLFPASYVYLTATVVEPNAKYWDRTQSKYITGPLKSKVFYQFAGMLPDFNKNGVDDLVDIRTKVSKDENGNGIVDEVEPYQYLKWWWLLIILLIIFIAWWRRRRRP